MQQETCLFISTNITPHKRNGRNCVLKFFHRDWRRCTMSYPRMVKTISLGMWRTSPLDLHTLGLHTSNFCFSINTLYRINLERLLFDCYVSLVFVWDHHYHLYMRELLEIWVGKSCMLLLYWEKGCLSWFLMTHIVAWFMSFFMSNNLQMLIMSYILFMFWCCMLFHFVWHELVGSMDTHTCI